MSETAPCASASSAPVTQLETTDFFTLFGLPKRFRLDITALSARYVALQRETHPDRFVTASPLAQRLAMQRATRVNEAYETLKSPVTRARYLLTERNQAKGIPPAATPAAAPPPDFLAQQMNWRENLAEARRQNDIAALQGLANRLDGEITAEETALATHLDDAPNAGAAEATAQRLIFLEKLRATLTDALMDNDIA
jgi:molecular chaperone HscB